MPECTGGDGWQAGRLACRRDVRDRTRCRPTGLDCARRDRPRRLRRATWRERLERLVDSLRGEGRLHELGEQIAAGELTEYLTTRLGIVEWRKRHPEISEVDVVPPIVIVGQARTGTTILHDLLAQDPRTAFHSRGKSIVRCRHRRPLPTTPIRASPGRRRYSTASSSSSPASRRCIRWAPARRRSACASPGGDFRSLIFPTQYRVPSYARWLLDDTDMASAYRCHRQFLQHLQSRPPGTAVGAEVACASVVPRRARSPNTRMHCSCRPTATRCASSHR